MKLAMTSIGHACLPGTNAEHYSTIGSRLYVPFIKSNWVTCQFAKN